MHLKKITVLFLFLVNVFAASAEERDPSYVVPFKTKLNFRLLANQNNFRLSIQPLSSLVYTKAELKSAQLNYGSYLPFSTGFAFNFMFGGFGYDFRFTQKYFNPTGKNESNLKDFKLSMLGKKVCFEGFYESFNHNYHNRNEKLFSSLEDYDGAIKLQHWGLNMRVITNETRFSYKAAFAQTEFQKKSAASFIFWFGYEQYQLRRENGLLRDTSAIKFFGNLKSTAQVQQHSWYLMPGFAGNLVYKKFYFANAIYVGSGPQFNKIYLDSARSKKINLPLLTRYRASIGINGKSFYTGIFTNVDYSRSAFQSLKTELFNYKIGIFLGLRVIKEKKSAEQRKEEKRKLKEDKNKRA